MGIKWGPQDDDVWTEEAARLGSNEEMKEEGVSCVDQLFEKYYAKFLLWHVKEIQIRGIKVEDDKKSGKCMFFYAFWIALNLYIPNICIYIIYCHILHRDQLMRTLSFLSLLSFFTFFTHRLRSMSCASWFISIFYSYFMLGYICNNTNVNVRTTNKSRSILSS